MSNEIVTALDRALDEQRTMFIDEVKAQGLTVKDIHEKTGINKTSLYSYLGRRQLLLKTNNSMKLVQLLGTDFAKRLYVAMKKGMAEVEVEEKFNK